MVTKYHCAKCNKTFSFPTAASFKRHIESVHEGKRPYKCEHCELRFEEKSKMKNHVMVVHDKQKSFNCGCCDSKFATKTYLKEHICQYNSGWRRHITLVHEKKKNEKHMSKSPKEIYDFQNIKVEPSTLQQFQTSNAYSFIIELLIHEIKEEGFEKNEATPIQDLTEVSIKQEEFGASMYLPK